MVFPILKVDRLLMMLLSSHRFAWTTFYLGKSSIQRSINRRYGPLMVCRDWSNGKISKNVGKTQISSSGGLASSVSRLVLQLLLAHVLLAATNLEENLTLLLFWEQTKYRGDSRKRGRFCPGPLSNSFKYRHRKRRCSMPWGETGETSIVTIVKTNSNLCILRFVRAN